jgi:hypothetical protein
MRTNGIPLLEFEHATSLEVLRFALGCIHAQLGIPVRGENGHGPTQADKGSDAMTIEWQEK